jgi:hypothetical protein
MAFYSQQPVCYDQIFAKTSSSLSKKRQYFQNLNIGSNVLVFEKFWPKKMETKFAEKFVQICPKSDQNLGI